MDDSNEFYVWAKYLSRPPRRPAQRPEIHLDNFDRLVTGRR